MLIEPLTRPSTAGAAPATTTTAHVLVVGAGQHFPALIAAADPLAAHTVLCRQEMLDRVRDPAAARQVIGLPAGAGVEEWIAAAAAVHAVTPLTRVAAFGELDQDRAAAIGQALGVPAVRPRTVTWVHDKVAMRARLRAAGLDATPVRRVRDEAELATFLRLHGGPCVVKPVQGAGSAGVSVIERPEQAAAAYALAESDFAGLPAAGVLVERFHRGPQYSVETISEGGEHAVVALVRKFSDPATLVEIGHLLPADLTPAAVVTCCRYVRQVLDALGITDGPAHTELVLTAAGPRVIETHVRLAGDDIPDLVRQATGVDLAACVARQAAGQPVLGDVRRALRDPHSGRHVAIWFALPAAGGTVVELRGLPAEPAPDVQVRALLEPGEQIDTPINSDSRVAQAVATAAGAARAVALARAAAEAVVPVVTLPVVSPDEPV
jgi:biotin carboxylase